MRRRSPEGRPLVVFVNHVARLSGGEIALTRLLPALAPTVDGHVILAESRNRDGDSHLRTNIPSGGWAAAVTREGVEPEWS